MPPNNRPRITNSLEKVRVLHWRGVAGAKDRAKADSGLRKGMIQRTVSVTPSLYYHLAHKCGIGFTEADRLVSQRRLFLDGKPLQARRALTVQIPAHLVERMELEIVTLSGHRVPVAARRLHRYYGFHNVDPAHVASMDEREPRAAIHVLRRAPAVSLENFTSPFAADIEHLPRVDKLTAADPLIDGLDAASTPQLICPKAVALPGIGGLALVTNDAVAMSHFRWQLGAWSSLEATFQRGTDPAAISAVAKATRREVLGVKLTRDADPLVKRSVVVNERDGRAVLRIDTPCFLKTMRDRIRALAPEELKCVAHASFSLDQANIDPGQFRRMTLEETDAFLHFEKRLKTQRLIANLRSIMDGGSVDQLDDMPSHAE